jgi:hypothetical protein
VQQNYNVVPIKKKDLKTLNTENKMLNSSLVKFVGCRFKKKICLKNRKVVYGKKNYTLSVKKKEFKRTFLQKCSKSFTYKSLVKTLKKHRSKKTFRNNKMLSTYSKMFFLLN